MIEPKTVFSEKTFANFINTKKDYQPRTTAQLNQLTKDTVELSKNTASDKNGKIFIAILGLAVGAAVGVLALLKTRKPAIQNITKNEVVESGKDKIVEKTNEIIEAIKPVDKSAEKVVNAQENRVKIAKDFLLPKDGLDVGARGICFFGPDSIGKEKAIEDFIKILEDGGYKIDRIPRADEMEKMELAGFISKKINEAENLFKETKQRTALIVRDMDVLGTDRTKTPEGFNPVVSALLSTENCDQKGFAWVWEAKTPKVVDPALLRSGRTDAYVLALPDENEGIEAWKGVQELIKDNKLIEPWYHEVVADTIEKLERK